MTPAQLALVRERHDRGLTQDHIASLCDCDRSLVSQWETGRTPIPEHALRRLADAGLRRPLEATVEASGGHIVWEDFPVPDEQRAKACTVRGLDAVQSASAFATEACNAEAPASPGGRTLTRFEAAELLAHARHNLGHWQQEVTLLEQQVRTADLRRIR